MPPHSASTRARSGRRGPRAARASAGTTIERRGRCESLRVPRMMRLRRLRQRFRSTAPQSAVYGRPFAAYVREAELVSSRASYHNEIHTLGQQIRPQPKALAAQAFDTVSLHGSAHFARHHQANSGGPQPSGRSRLPSNQQREVHRRNPPPAPLRAGKLGVIAQSAVAPEG